MKLWIVGFLAIVAWAQDVPAQGASRQAWGTRQPRVSSKSEPEYSEEGRRAGVNATILLSLVVNENGEPEDIQIERGARFGLDETALQCIQTWRFEPGTKDGKPFKAATHIEVNFSQLAKGHQNQRASLTFTLPSGGVRPELVKGAIPPNPDGVGDALLRVRLTVGPDGKPKNLNILETTDEDWANQALKKMKEWRLRTAAPPGQDREIQGLFELTVGHPKASDKTTGTGAGMVIISPPEVQDRFLPAPKLLAPADHALFDSYPRRMTCKWEASAGALSYLLEWDYMYRDAWHAEYLGIPGTAFIVNGTEFTFDFAGGQPGRWRVWAVNANGQRGNPSEWRTFRYLH